MAIKTFKSDAVRELFETGKSRRIDTKLHKRAKGRLDALHATSDLRALYLPGFELHKWKGWDNKWSISVSGPWRVTFTWINGDAYDVDLEQPH
jgi:proteic killer suppression protein